MMLTCSAACLLVLAEALDMLRWCTNCLLGHSFLFAWFWGAGRQQHKVAATLHWKTGISTGIFPCFAFQEHGEVFSFVDGEIWFFNPSHSPHNIPVSGEASSLIGLTYRFTFQTQWVNIDVVKNGEKLNTLSSHKYNPLPDKRKIYLSI